MSSFSNPLNLLHQFLVDPPFISSFQWTPNKNFASSFTFLFSTIFSYLSLTLLVRTRLLPLPSLSPSSIRRISTLHNLLLLLLSLTMAVGCSLAASSQMPSLTWLLCFPPSTAPKGPVFFWAQVFYLSKFYELFDTVVILLTGGKRLSFLHVYHHAVVIVMAYIWLYTCQSLMPVALVVNAGVHVAMYAYFLSVGFGWRWGRRWKRAVTRLQIGQFVFSFVASGGFLWMHFRGGGCEGVKGWVFNAVFNVSLLLLFVDFYSVAYGKEKKKKKGV